MQHYYYNFNLFYEEKKGKKKKQVVNTQQCVITGMSESKISIFKNVFLLYKNVFI